MKAKDYWAIIILIFLLTLGVRLFFAFDISNFSDDESYYSLRQIEHISKTGVPLIYDELSYGGRIHIVSPFFYYLLAFFNLFMPLTLVGKLIPNIFANLVVIFAFLISKEITKNIKVSLFIGVFAAFLPVYFTYTVNSVTSLSLFFPMLLALIYCFMKISSNKGYLIGYIVLTIFLSLTHIASYIFICALLVYALLIRIDKIFVNSEEYEVIFFSFLFTIWCQFIIYKKAFLEYGGNILSQNIPEVILSGYFDQISLIELISYIGIIPLVFGTYIVYRYSFLEKKKTLYIMISFILVIMPLLWFKMIPIIFGFIMIGLFLSILFSQYLKIFLTYIQKTKFSDYENVFISIFILLFLFTSVISTVFYTQKEMANSFSFYEVEAMMWLKENTQSYQTILTTYLEGNFLAYYAQRKNVIDLDFMLIDNIDQRFEDVESVFTSTTEVRTISLLNKYNVEYIYFSKRAKELYNLNRMIVADDKRCFEKVFDNRDVEIYQLFCTVREV
jgi:hypothetical protein